MRRMVVIALLVVVGCSSASPSFELTGATVEPAYTCPAGAHDAAYDLHVTVDAHNGTAKTVTIESATAEMVLTAVKGSWLEKVGDRYDADKISVTPVSLTALSTATLIVAIPSACTSGKTVASSGTYTVTVRLVTSAGKYSITAGNTHVLRA
jgi:hypothetical protein